MTVSYYGGKFAGRKTASGEIFNPKELTAAHKTLPFGTKIRVTEPQQNKSVVVRINDRGPFIAGRDLDVSKAAAAQLGILQQGVAKLHYEILQ